MFKMYYHNKLSFSLHKIQHKTNAPNVLDMITISFYLYMCIIRHLLSFYLCMRVIRLVPPFYLCIMLYLLTLVVYQHLQQKLHQNETPFCVCAPLCPKFLLSLFYALTYEVYAFRHKGKGRQVFLRTYGVDAVKSLIRYILRFCVVLVSG